jgi:hypothetical protein
MWPRTWRIARYESEVPEPGYWRAGHPVRRHLDGEPLLSAWPHIIADITATELPIDSADAIFAGRLPWEHRDPFDRMLVAQAARRSLTIATRDKSILRAALTPTLKI